MEQVCSVCRRLAAAPTHFCHPLAAPRHQYASEGVDVATIEFINNQECVDLIEATPDGLLPTLDEICYLNRATTDIQYLEKLNRAHNDNRYYGVCVRARARGVRFGAGLVPPPPATVPISRTTIAELCRMYLALHLVPLLHLLPSDLLASRLVALQARGNCGRTTGSRSCTSPAASSTASLISSRRTMTRFTPTWRC